MISKAIKKRTYEHFESGFHCAEAVSKTVLEMFSEEPDTVFVKCASGFGGGIAGTTEELCGAFSGGVIALGYLLGRENPGDNMKDCGRITKEFKSKFEEKFGSINCAALLKGFGEQGNHKGCMELTAETSVMLADLLKEFENQTHITLDTFCCQPREKVAAGNCPYGGCACQ